MRGLREVAASLLLALASTFAVAVANDGIAGDVHASAQEVPLTETPSKLAYREFYMRSTSLLPP